MDEVEFLPDPEELFSLLMYYLRLESKKGLKSTIKNIHDPSCSGSYSIERRHILLEWSYSIIRRNIQDGHLSLSVFLNSLNTFENFVNRVNIRVDELQLYFFVAILVASKHQSQMIEVAGFFQYIQDIYCVSEILRAERNLLITLGFSEMPVSLLDYFGIFAALAHVDYVELFIQIEDMLPSIVSDVELFNTYNQSCLSYVIFDAYLAYHEGFQFVEILNKGGNDISQIGINPNVVQDCYYDIKSIFEGKSVYWLP